jgi:hypothetical protein
VLRLAAILIGLGFSAVIGFVLYLATYDTPYRCELACSRAEDICNVQQLTVAHSRAPWSLPLSAIERAQVRVFPARRGAPRISVYLISGGNSYYFADYSSRDHADRDAARIRQFLASSDGQLSIVVDDRPSFYLIGFLFFVVAVLLILLWRVMLKVAIRPAVESSQAVDTPQPAS